MIHIDFSDNGNHTRVRIPSLPDKLDETNNIKETSKLQVRPKTIIQPLSSNDTQVKIKIATNVKLTYSMILSFHMPPLASGQGLCDIDRV